MDTPDKRIPVDYALAFQAEPQVLSADPLAKEEQAQRLASLRHRQRIGKRRKEFTFPTRTR